MAEKRPYGGSPDPSGQQIVAAKKQRTEQGGQLVTKDGVRRTSTLLAPTMQLRGHEGEVYSTEFSPDGQNIASSAFDKHVLLWHITGNCENYALIKGHQNAVLEVHWLPSGEQLVSCSADRTVRGWDALTGEQIKKYKEHTAVVNSCFPLRRGSPLLASGSDDCTCKIWDFRTKRSVSTLREKFQVTAVTFSEAGNQVYTGSIDNSIKVWDLRKEGLLATHKGHTDSVTGISLSPDGSHLLSNAMDNTLRVWDMRPYAPSANRCVKMLVGHIHNFEKQLLRCCWSADGRQVAAGSADRMVNIWEVSSGPGRLQYKLPGHAGSVNDCAFHPSQPIIASASSDKTLYLGELMQ
ncbi:WD40 repeat-like protein [Dunaliella salina]|uniref:WD40 repeat-like protein n=1 Tax=Dunaliella salina TaxID=3046 RepID=A0ABQ7GGH2_DUNSA|nr:WD40 repeat-like protein [Dunaliella salina]|eukprot:KAF5833706.1 WD40 repeat-like protein [Dunaliella salina]